MEVPRLRRRSAVSPPRPCSGSSEHPHFPKYTWRFLLEMANGTGQAKAKIQEQRRMRVSRGETSASSARMPSPHPCSPLSMALRGPCPRSLLWVFSEATGPQGCCSLPLQVAHSSSFHRPTIRSTAPSRKASKGEINWTAKHESHG